MTGNVLFALALSALLVPLFGLPWMWRETRTAPPLRSAIWRVLGAASFIGWFLSTLADWEVVRANGLIAALANALFVAVPVVLVFCLPAAAVLRNEKWRAPYVVCCVATCVVGLPLGFLSAVLIGCGLLHHACL